jgi:hypothetical protein
MYFTRKQTALPSPSDLSNNISNNKEEIHDAAAAASPFWMSSPVHILPPLPTTPHGSSHPKPEKKIKMPNLLTAASLIGLVRLCSG